MRLSARETQLLELAAEGLTDSAIAHRLGISETTVSTYWSRIRTKVGPVSRTQLVAKALQRGYLHTIAALREENRRLAQGLDAQVKGKDIYRHFIEEAADAILIVSEQGVIEMLNHAAADLFGWAEHELVGKHISMLLPERYRDHHAAFIARYVAAPVKRTMGDHATTPALHRSGAEFPIHASLSGIVTSHGTSVICILRAAHPA